MTSDPSTDEIDEARVRAWELSRLGRHDDAVAVLVRTLSADPENVDLLVSLSQVHQAADKRDEAYAAAVAAVRVDPTAAEAHGALGTALRMLCREEEAIDELRRSTELDPWMMSSRCELVRALDQAGRRDEARTVADEAVALDANDTEAHYELGCLWVDEDPDRAAESFRRVLQIDPHYSKAQQQLIGMELARGEDGGLQGLAHSLATRPADPLPPALLDRHLALVPVVSSVVRLLAVAVLLLLAHLGAPAWALLIALLAGILVDAFVGGAVYAQILVEVPAARASILRSWRRSPMTIAGTICSLLSDAWWAALIVGTWTGWWTPDLRWGWLSVPFALTGAFCAGRHLAATQDKVTSLL